MKLSDEQLDEFIRIYKEEFGEELNPSQAQEMASDLLRLYEALASRRPRETIDGRTSEDETEKA